MKRLLVLLCLPNKAEFLLFPDLLEGLKGALGRIDIDAGHQSKEMRKRRVVGNSAVIVNQQTDQNAAQKQTHQGVLLVSVNPNTQISPEAVVASEADNALVAQQFKIITVTV